MNSNNNAVTMQELIQRVNSTSKMMESVGSTQENGQDVAKFSSRLAPPVQNSNLLRDVFSGENGFSGVSIAPAAPQPSISFAEYHNGGTPVLRSTPPRPFHSPSRSFSMPATSRAITYGQFNVAHVPQASLFPPHSTYPNSSLAPLQTVPTAPERYRLMTNHSPHAIPRFQGTLARCPSNSLPNYRPPYSTPVLPGASAGTIRGANPNPEKEQKESSNTRKKRKACGHCEPCRRKENCGSCMNCINRAKGKQICVHRKCEVLKKKPASSNSYLSSCDSIHEKRKEFESGILPKRVKRSKSNDTSNELLPEITHPILHPSFSDFSDLTPSLIPQSFNNRPILNRPDCPASENFSSFLASASNTFKQAVVEPSEPSTLSVPSEATDFINQTISEIESNMQSQSPKSDDNFSQLHELQPTVQLAPNASFSWNATDLPGKLLKSLTSESNSLLSSQALGTGLTGELDQITKPDPLFESFTTSNANTTSVSESNTVQNSYRALQQETSSRDHLIAENPVRLQQLVPSDSVIQRLDFPNYGHPQLNPSTSMSNPSSQLATSGTQNPLTAQSSHFTALNQISANNDNVNNFSVESDVRFSQNQNSWNPYLSMQNVPAHSAVPTAVELQGLGNRPPSNTQEPPTFPARKLSSNSGDSFHLQRHLSVGSRGSNQSPMTHSSPGAGSASLHHVGPHSNLKSPMAGMPTNSPAPSHISSMMGSPASSMHISPAQSQSPFTPGPPLSNFSTQPPEREIQQNGPSSWPEQHKSDFNRIPNYNYHVTHSVALTSNCVQKPCASPLAPNPVPNRFLARPDSSNTYVPCSETTASRSSTSCSSSCVSAAAVRLNPAESHLKDDVNSGQLHAPPPDSVVQHKIFKETMSSVLYSDEALNRDRTMQHGCSNDKMKIKSRNISSVQLIESPTDVHPTISPGESGYDSTEFGSVSSDTLSQQSLSHDVLLEQHTPTFVQPKNAHAALAGTKYQRSFSFESCRASKTLHSMSDVSNARWLPAKAAFIQAPGLSFSETIESEENLPKSSSHTYSRYEMKPFLSTARSLYTSTVSRSLSVDSGYPDKKDHDFYFDSLQSDKPTLHLRRYSFQGFDATTKPRQPTSLHSCSFSTPDFRPTPSVTEHTKPVTNSLPSSIYPVNTSSHLYSHPSPLTTILDSRPSTDGTSCVTSNHATSFPSRLQSFQNGRENVDLTSDDLRGRMVSYKASNGNILKKTVFPQCQCRASGEVEEEAPYYTHLGTAADVKGIRKIFEDRTGHKGSALRIERVLYTGKEGKTSHGCPVAKWIIRRASAEEKVLVICRERPGHHCATAFTVIMIMLWDGIDRQLANEAYEKCTKLIPTNGVATERRCGTNDERTCACQGFNDDKGGASFSFGCSWSMYYNGCKFARSVNPNKFKLSGTNDHTAEATVGDFCQHLATIISSIYKNAAPDAHRNQTEHEREGFECRLGHNPIEEGRPFSGVTCCMDFCAHSHKDKHNMDNGTTVVVTLTKPENRVIGQKPADEQLHVLPLYRWVPCNEDGTLNGIGEKIKNGAIEILSGFRRAVRIRDKPLGTCKQRKERKKRAELAAFITPPKRKKGKAKRSLSMENVADIGKVSLTKNHQLKDLETQDQNFSQWGSVHPDSPKNANLPSVNSFRQPFCTPPPRWPYRRHVSATPEINCYYSASQSNLPSIGSFFDPSSSPVQNLKSPVPKLASPSPPPSFQFGSRLSATSPSPSTLPIPMTDFRESFSPHGSGQICSPANVAVKMEPRTDPYACYSESVVEPPVALKSYARLTSRYEIKQEPVETGFASQHDHGKWESPLQSPLVQQREVFSDAEENFHDPDIGGVAVAPAHGSILIECAKRELHATTSLLKPNRFEPSRISLVFYQHKNMNYRNHGAAEYVVKEAKRNLEKAEKREAAEKAEMEKQEKKRQEAIQRHINPALFNSYEHALLQSNLPQLPRTGETTVEVITDQNFSWEPNTEFSHQMPPYHPMPSMQVMPSPELRRSTARFPVGHQSSYMSDFQATNKRRLVAASEMFSANTVPNRTSCSIPPFHSSMSSARPIYHPPGYSSNFPARATFHPHIPNLRPNNYPAVQQRSHLPLKQQSSVAEHPQPLVTLSSCSTSPKKLFTVL